MADGSLEQMLLAPQPAVAVAAAKCVAHWLLTGLPLIVATPLVGLLFDMSRPALAGAGGRRCCWARRCSACSAALGAALTLGLRSGGMLLILIVLPLTHAGADLRRRRGGRRRGGPVGGRALLAARRAAAWPPRWARRWPPRRRCASPPNEPSPRATSLNHRMRLYTFAAPSRFYALAGRLMPWLWAATVVLDRGRPVHRLLRRAHRRHAGRRLPHHLHPRARGLDVDGAVPGDGLLGRHRLGLQRAPGVDGGARHRAHRRDVHLRGAVDRRPLGQADLGRLVGVGRAADLAS